MISRLFKNIIKHREHLNPHCRVRCAAGSATTAMSDINEMPSPRGLPIFGTTLSLIAAGSAPKLHKYIDRRHQQLGPIFKERIGPIACVFISDPEEMRAVFAQEGKYPVHVLPEAWTLYNQLYGCSRGLFFMNGEEWLYNRRIMNKLLLKGDFKWIENACEEVSARMVERWKIRTQPTGLLSDIEAELYRWSLDVLVAILLGTEHYKLCRPELEGLLERLASVVHLVFQHSAKLSLMPAALASRLRIPHWKRFVSSVDEALNTANELVFKLLDYPAGNGLLAKMCEEDLLKSDISRIIVDFVLAAGDTTAYSMEWILYLIAKHTDVQERLNNELSTSFLKNVIKESLRLYPVAPFLTRVTPQETSIGGYRVPAGTLIIMSIYTSSRDPRHFNEPELFIPDRWVRDNLKNTSSGMQVASLPFAMGARSCIGRKIAEIQLQITLANIVENFKIELRNTEEIEMVLKMVAVPSQPLKLEFVRR